MKYIDHLLKKIGDGGKSLLGFNLKRTKTAEEGLPPNNTGQSPTPTTPPVQQPMQQQLPPTGTGVTTPTGPDPAIIKEIETYIGENREALNNMDRIQSDLLTAIDRSQQEQDPSILMKAKQNIPVGINQMLYDAIKKDPSIKNLFIQMTREATGDPRSDIFVGLFYAKTDAILNDPEMKQYDEMMQKGLTQGPEIEKHEDPMLQTYTQTIFDISRMNAPDNSAKLTDADIQAFIEAGFPKNKVQDLQGVKLTNAVDKALGPPADPKLTDQRMNFFIRNPHFLKPVFDNDANFLAQLKEALQGEQFKPSENKRRKGESVEVDPKADIYTQIQQAGSDSRRKRLLSQLLNNAKGPELYEILRQLITNKDPSIALWLKPYLYEGNKQDAKTRREVAYDPQVMQKGEQDPFVSQNYYSQLNPVEQESFKKQLNALLQQYLQRTLNEMITLKEAAVDTVKDQAVNEMQQVELSGRHDADAKSKKAAAMAQYDLMEKLHAFSTMALAQLQALFISPPHDIVDNYDNIIYANDYGNIVIPKSTLKDMFGELNLSPEELRKNKPIEDYIPNIASYIQKEEAGQIEHPFEPNFSSTVSYQLAATAYERLGKLKQAILKIAGEVGKPVTEEQYNGIKLQLEQKYPEERQTLQEFVGDDAYDFIYMTLRQNKDYAKNLIDTATSKTKKTNLKSQVGATWHTYILPQLAQIQEGTLADQGLQPVSSKSVKSFISLFDHDRKIRSGGSTARSRNTFDPQYRRNADMYYALMGGDTPDHVDTLLAIQEEALDRAEKEKGERKITTDMWEYKFFEMVDKFNGYENTLSNKMGQVQRLEADKKARIDEYNQRVGMDYLDEIAKHPDHNERLYQYGKLWDEGAKRLVVPTKKDKKTKKVEEAWVSDKQMADFKEARTNRDKFIATMDNWIGGKFDNYYYYVILGRAWARTLYNEDEAIRIITEEGVGKTGRANVKDWSIDKIQTEMQALDKQMAEFAEQHGVPPEQAEKLRRMGYPYYKKMVEAMARIDEMKQMSVKFAYCNLATCRDFDQLKDRVRSYYEAKIAAILE